MQTKNKEKPQSSVCPMHSFPPHPKLCSFATQEYDGSQMCTVCRSLEPLSTVSVKYFIILISHLIAIVHYIFSADTAV